jgi:fructose/tagatose bisphosphate aldolase
MRPMREFLDGARKGGYAVGAFNVYSYETILGAMKAAQEVKVSVTVAFGERYLEPFSRSGWPRYTGGAEIHRDLQGVGKRQP